MENEKYIVSARKYRPSTFKSVVGQKTLVNTLKNAIESNRLAQAYLFCGPRGVGKTSTARIFAKTINCLNLTPDGEACGVCESCRAIEEGHSFNLTELDAASNNGVNDIRALNEQVNTPPQTGRYRVFIIDEVHMLSTGAFNAFLKTLEEPPSYVIFILATTDKHKVLPTILSRCQIYDFKRITPADAADHLEYVARTEGITAERSALDVIARKADGAMRDALSIFDQVAASSRGNITYQSTIENLNILDYEYYFRLVEAFRAGDIPQALLLYAQIREKGFDSLFFVNGLANHVRDLMMGATEATLPLLEQSEEIARRYREQAQTLPLNWYYAALKLLSDCDLAYRTATEKRLLVELTLIRLCQLLNPPAPPFDRLEGEPPLKPMSVAPSQSAPQATAPAAVSAPQPTAPPPTTKPTTATQAPAAAPAPPQPQAAPSAPTVSPKTTSRSSRRPSSFSLNSTTPQTLKENASSQPPQSPAPTAPQSAPEPQSAPRGDRKFSDEEMAEAWMGFIAANPDRRVLSAAMRTTVPERIEGERFRVLVDHQGSMGAYQADALPLVQYLRKRLGNESVTLEFQLAAPVETEHKLPPKELLQEMVSNNPILGQFLRDIDAQMA